MNAFCLAVCGMSEPTVPLLGPSVQVGRAVAMGKVELGCGGSYGSRLTCSVPLFKLTLGALLLLPSHPLSFFLAVIIYGLSFLVCLIRTLDSSEMYLFVRTVQLKATGSSGAQ